MQVGRRKRSRRVFTCFFWVHEYKQRAPDREEGNRKQAPASAP